MAAGDPWAGLAEGVNHGAAPGHYVHVLGQGLKTERGADNCAAGEVGFDLSAGVFQSFLNLGFREVGDGFRNGLHRRRQVHGLPLGKDVFDLLNEVFQAVCKTAIAETHGEGHLGGLGSGEDIEGGKAESNDLGGVDHLRPGAGAIGRQRFDDFRAISRPRNRVGRACVNMDGVCGIRREQSALSWLSAQASSTSAVLGKTLLGQRTNANHHIHVMVLVS